MYFQLFMLHYILSIILNIYFKQDFINRRKMTEYGNIALIEEREAREGGSMKLKLPGARKGDLAARVFKPEVS